jgi:hypothetical protein
MKVFQIYFDQSQIDKLEPGFIPYFNEKCTVYFENQVIRELIEKGEHLNRAYFGVVSYNMRDKHFAMRMRWNNIHGIRNESDREFSFEDFCDVISMEEPEAMSFQTHAPHDPIAFANRVHPGFLVFWTHILEEIGYKWEPTVYENVFYCNYFVAKRNVYDKYVREMLIPAMEVMKEIPELMQRCLYPRVPSDRLKADLGIDHYPWHPFILERLFTFYAHIHNLKCSHF